MNTTKTQVFFSC